MSTIPRLTDRESQLLSLYIQLGADIHAVIAAEGLSSTDALDWYLSPAVQAHLAVFEELAARSLALRAAESRLAALYTLEFVTRTSEDPVERRRAATAISRITAPQRRNRSDASPQPERSAEALSSAHSSPPSSDARAVASAPEPHAGASNCRETAGITTSCAPPNDALFPPNCTLNASFDRLISSQFAAAGSAPPDRLLSYHSRRNPLSWSTSPCAAPSPSPSSPDSPSPLPPCRPSSQASPTPESS